MRLAVAGTVLAGLMLAGCSSAADGQAASSAESSEPVMSVSPQGSPAPKACASPHPTSSWMGGSTTGLPDDVRCLPHVLDGEMLAPPPEAAGAVGGGQALTIHVTEDTTPEDALALCRRLTDLGYGTGGSHGVSALNVGGFDAGHYMSMPNRRPCMQIR